MNRKDLSQKQQEKLCSELGAEDGIDPRDLARQSTTGKKGGRKTLQLCGQVAEALNYAFGSVCNDDLIRELGVISVQPAPDESRLLVTVGPMLPGPFDPAQVLSRLQQAMGKLRTEVATSIHRKKVPDLTFHVVHPTKSG